MRTILGLFLLGVVTIVGGVIGGLYLSAHDAINDISAHSVGVKRRRRSSRRSRSRTSRRSR